MSLHDDMTTIGQQALAASRALVALKSRKKNSILEAMAQELEARRDAIKAANAIDIEEGRNAGLSSAMLDRLLLTEARIDGMISGIQAVAALKDPIGSSISRWIRPNGLEIIKQRVPIGVIGIIYESRPNVTADSAVLCFKTSNAVILRGGKEAVHSNAAIADALIEGGKKRGMPDHAIQLICHQSMGIVQFARNVSAAIASTIRQQVPGAHLDLFVGCYREQGVMPPLCQDPAVFYDREGGPNLCNSLAHPLQRGNCSAIHIKWQVG